MKKVFTLFFLFVSVALFAQDKMLIVKTVAKGKTQIKVYNAQESKLDSVVQNLKLPKDIQERFHKDFSKKYKPDVAYGFEAGQPTENKTYHITVINSKTYQMPTVFGEGTCWVKPKQEIQKAEKAEKKKPISQ